MDFSAIDFSTMDWSNETVIEFLGLIEAEPSIWNHKSRHHKTREYVNAAWARIQSRLSIQCTIEELKRKRNSLLTQYRECLRKIKVSSESAPDGVYRPTWFAFDRMHSYLSTLYDRPLSYRDYEGRSRVGIKRHLSPESQDSDYMMDSKLESTTRSESPSSGSHSFSFYKKHREIQDELYAKKQTEMEEAKERSNHTQDEKKPSYCDLYGKLLAEKLKLIQEDHRLTVMNEIDKLVFNYVMKARKENCSDESSVAQPGTLKHEPPEPEQSPESSEQLLDSSSLEQGMLIPSYPGGF